MTEIRFNGVSKTFNGQKVIDSLDLTVNSGEFFTFLGKSGSGKSTLLNMVAGLAGPSRGEIFFGGQPVTGIDPGKRDVAMVFQNYALYPHLTVYQNMAFPLKVRKYEKDRIDGEVRAAARKLGIEELLDRMPSQISGGQKQRTALGRALVRRPGLFLMDEPLSNLDAGLRLELRREIKNLHRELGTTVLYVTHDQEEAMALSDRMAILDMGKIRQVGKPLEVYHDPVDTEAAKFIGSPPVNLLPARLLEGTGVSVPAPGLLAGIRPAELTAGGDRMETSIEATVAMVEPAGDVLWLECEWEGEKLMARADGGYTPETGSRCYLSFKRGTVFFFDGESGKRYRAG